MGWWRYILMTSTSGKRWLRDDPSILQIKLFIIVKPLTHALNPALNCVNPLVVSRFAIKALRAYTGFKGLDQESSMSIPGVLQDSLVVHNGCYLKRGPDGLQVDSWWSQSRSVAQCNYLELLLVSNKSWMNCECVTWLLSAPPWKRLMKVNDCITWTLNTLMLLIQVLRSWELPDTCHEKQSCCRVA